MLIKRIGSTIGIILFSMLMLNAQTSKTVWMDDLSIDKFSEGIRPVKARTNYLTKTISIGSMSYQRGVSGITPFVFSIYLKGNAHRFTAEVGVDDSANREIPIKFYLKVVKCAWVIRPGK
jgi:alpha-galactosidase